MRVSHLKAIVNHTMAMNKPWSLTSGAASDIMFFITFWRTMEIITTFSEEDLGVACYARVVARIHDNVSL